ncbi:DUF2975 domain-containing protein [Candidatus Dependentiae bacterium]|nr:DUF2975 domain-containing protein [Candidatus Dependentiae bacterium]
MVSITKYTRLIQITSIACAVIVTVVTCLSWVSDLFPTITALFQNSGEGTNALTRFKELSAIPFSHRCIGFIVDGIALSILWVGIVFLNRVLKRFQAGDFFSLENIHLFTLLSRVALAWALYMPLRVTLLSLITTLHKGVGHRMLTLQLSIQDSINIGIFLGLALLTSLIEESSKLKKEHDLTI